MSHPSGIDGHSGGRFGAATPGARPERARIDDLVAMGGSRPAATRRRRVVTPWRMVALIAAIIVAGGTYALGRYVIAPKPSQVVHLAVTTRQLQMGTKLTPSALGMVTVRRSSVPAGALSVPVAKHLLGKFAIQPIPVGTFLTRQYFADIGKPPDSQKALVGLALKPGQMPVDGLAVGQQVEVMLIPDSAQGGRAIALHGATIWALLPPDSSGGEQVTVLVRRNQASVLANYAAHGQVSLVAVGTNQHS